MTARRNIHAIAPHHNFLTKTKDLKRVTVAKWKTRSKCQQATGEAKRTFCSCILKANAAVPRLSTARLSVLVRTASVYQVPSVALSTTNHKWAGL
jgi:hypothetical protein